MPATRLDGKVAVVTGGSRGIGSAIALALAAEGAAVVINFQGDRPAAETVAAAIQARGGRASIVRADVAVADETAALFEAAEAQFGPVDILVNNAGLARYGLIAEYAEKDFDRLFAVNVKGVFLA